MTDFHLSASSLRTFGQCPKQWAAEKVDGHRRRRNSAMVKGSALDAVATFNWSQKALSGEDIDIDQGKHIAEDAFRMQVEDAGGRSEIDWNEGLGSALESSMKMAERHLKDHAPLYTPRAVQKRLSRYLPDGMEVFGFIDAVISDDHLVDVKSGGRKMPADDAAQDIQATTYAWLMGHPIDFEFLRVIDTGARPVHSEIVHTRRTDAALEWFEELALGISQQIEAGNFPPNPGWHCKGCVIREQCIDRLTHG